MSAYPKSKKTSATKSETTKRGATERGATKSEARKKNAMRSPSNEGFSEAERAAMTVRAAELKADARPSRASEKAAADEQAVLAKIAETPESDRAMAERIVALVARAASELAPKLWYGQPAFAKNGTVVCFFRSGQMDKARYSSFAFSEAANLDDDTGLWPTSFALAELTDAAEIRLTKLVEQAMR